jgi:hypothetical protein
MVKRLILIAVIFGCLQAAPQDGEFTELTEISGAITEPELPSGLPPAGAWHNISTDDKFLIGLVLRSVNFINNELKLSPALQ